MKKHALLAQAKLTSTFPTWYTEGGSIDNRVMFPMLFGNRPFPLWGASRLLYVINIGFYMSSCVLSIRAEQSLLWMVNTLLADKKVEECPSTS